MPLVERVELIAAIERRMRKNGIFYQDIFDRILLTETSVLREILSSDFEQQVLAMKKPS